MSIESFQKLKEIDSLNKIKTSLAKNHLEEQNRLKILNDKLNEAIRQSEQNQQKIISFQLELSEIDHKIKLFTEQKKRITEFDGDVEKIKNFDTEIEKLESDGLNLLTEIDLIETEITDKKTFISGLKITIREIEVEVNENLQKIQSELQNLELRINLLMNDLPDHFLSTLKFISSKNLAHGPFTRIDQGSCYFCRFKISRLDESEIDMQKNLKTCSQCSRIFLPYGS